MKSGDEVTIGGKRFTLLYEHFDGLWMVSSTDEPNSVPILRSVKDFDEAQ